MSAHNSDPLPTPTAEEMAAGQTYPPDCLGCGCRYIDHGEPGLACPEFAGGFSRVYRYRDTPVGAA